MIGRLEIVTTFDLKPNFYGNNEWYMNEFCVFWDIYTMSKTEIYTKKRKKNKQYH